MVAVHLLLPRRLRATPRDCRVKKASRCSHGPARILVDHPRQLLRSRQDAAPLQGIATRAGDPRPMKTMLLRIFQALVTVGVLVWVFHDPQLRANVPAVLRRAEPGWILLGVAFAGAG